MTTHSADQTLANYIRDLGAEFGPLFCHAHNEWCFLWDMWHQYENLFGRNKERVDLLNKTGGSFFAHVEKHFFEAAVLAICRLSDPPKTGNKDNLTIMKFIEFMQTDERKSRMTALLKDVTEKTEHHRKLRSKRIAHNDLALKTKTVKLQNPVTMKDMNEAISALHSVFKYVINEFRNSDLLEIVITNPDEKKLLFYLFDGLRAQEQHHEAIKAGHYRRLNYPEWLQDERDDPMSESKFKAN